VEKFRLEMKSTDRSEDTVNSKEVDELGACVKQEQNEYGPINFQSENSLSVTRSIKREQSDDKTVIKQEDVRSGRQDQEDDNSHQSEGM
jgi:hypothetical protein